MTTTTDLESIVLSQLDSVCGGASVGEIACRSVGAVAGAAGGAAANIYGAVAKSTTLGALTMAGSGLASLVGGAFNGDNASSATAGGRDRMLGLAGTFPVVGAPFAGVTMGKVGWSAGGAACGYGWK